MGALALVWLLAWPGFVAPLASLPTWFAQVGFVDPTALSSGFAGGAVEVLLAWPGGVGAINPHPCFLVLAVLVGSWPGLVAASAALVACLAVPQANQR